MNNPESDVPYKYFNEDSNNRESRVTRFLSRQFYENILEIVKLEPPVVICSELNKSRYDRIGDVDLVICKLHRNGPINPENIEKMIAFEIKVSVYEGNGKYRSLKLGKHERQLENLKKEAWDQIYLMDIVVTDPYPGWMHPYALDILDSFAKDQSVKECGHILLVKTSVLGRSENESGGIFKKMLIPGIQRELENNLYDVRTKFSSSMSKLGINQIEFVHVIQDNPKDKTDIKMSKWFGPGLQGPLEKITG